MRCFVAVKVAEPVRMLLARVQEALRRAEADVKWVEMENLHLTLKFLGELGEEAVAALKADLEVEAARWPALEVEVAGVGAFPEGGAPKVVWAGMRGDLEKLAGLAAAIERAAERVGVPREGRLFVPHLTLGRVKSPRNAQRLRAAIENQREAVFGRETVTAFELVQSHLSPKGSRYETAGTFALAKR